MAEDKKKEEGEEGKKKGLPAIVLIAVGAIVGGAGAVFAIPPKTVKVPEVEKPKKVFDVTHPDLIEHEFNVRTRTGKSVGRIKFKFVYTVREDLEEKAYKKIAENWDQATHDSLMLLSRRTVQELQSESGLRMLEHDLVQALDTAFFGRDEHDKVASVSRVLIAYILTQ